MPLTFTAPIEEIPGLIALTLQSSDRKSALEVLSTTGRFPPPWTDERNWSPLIANMTVEQAATLKGLAEAAYELVPLHSDYDSLVWASRRVAGCG